MPARSSHLGYAGDRESTSSFRLSIPPPRQHSGRSHGEQPAGGEHARLVFCECIGPAWGVAPLGRCPGETAGESVPDDSRGAASSSCVVAHATIGLRHHVRRPGACPLSSSDSPSPPRHGKPLAPSLSVRRAARSRSAPRPRAPRPGLGGGVHEVLARLRGAGGPSDGGAPRAVGTCFAPRPSPCTVRAFGSRPGGG